MIFSFSIFYDNQKKLAKNAKNNIFTSKRGAAALEFWHNGHFGILVSAFGTSPDVLAYLALTVFIFLAFEFWFFDLLFESSFSSEQSESDLEPEPDSVSDLESEPGSVSDLESEPDSVTDLESDLESESDP